MTAYNKRTGTMERKIVDLALSGVAGDEHFEAFVASLARDET
jgi:hypothetical protein